MKMEEIYTAVLSLSVQSGRRRDTSDRLLCISPFIVCEGSSLSDGCVSQTSKRYPGIHPCSVLQSDERSSSVLLYSSLPHSPLLHTRSIWNALPCMADGDGRVWRMHWARDRCRRGGEEEERESREGRGGSVGERAGWVDGDVKIAIA